MAEIEHKTIAANGLNIHIAELGKGPLVLFIHGFPELWYSWRHQILFMAAHGDRVVAPDLRGYGDTTGAPIHDVSKFTVFHVVGDLIALLQEIAPDEDKVLRRHHRSSHSRDVSKFTVFHVVGDLIALLQEISPDEDKVFVVGHDWGAIIAWQLSLFRPDKVKALVNLSVAFNSRNPKFSAVDGVRMLYGDDHYICRFQEPGDIEAEFANVGVKEVLKKFYTYRTPGAILLPKGEPFRDFTDHVVLPPWLTEDDLDYYASKFEKTGFTAAVNYYRALTLSWELSAAWTGAQVKVPVKFVVGDLDLVYHVHGAKDYIHKGGFKKDVPFVEEIVVMEDAAHFINQEKPDEISNHIYDFIKQF